MCQFLNYPSMGNWAIQSHTIWCEYKSSEPCEPKIFYLTMESFSDLQSPFKLQFLFCCCVALKGFYGNQKPLSYTFPHVYLLFMLLPTFYHDVRNLVGVISFDPNLQQLSLITTTIYTDQDSHLIYMYVLSVTFVL